jgi:hypothetical protein
MKPIDKNKRAKARALCEVDDLPDEEIAQRLKIGRTTISRWKVADSQAGNPWARGSLVHDRYEAEQNARIDAAAKKGITKDSVLNEFAALGFTNFTDLVNVKPGNVVEIKPLKQLGEAAKAIKAIKQRRTVRTDKDGNQTEEIQTEIITHDKVGALTKMGEELGMFKTPAEKMQEVGVLAFYRDLVAKRKGRQ